MVNKTTYYYMTGVMEKCMEKYDPASLKIPVVNGKIKSIQ
jgi:hypothetical protein